MSNTESKKHCHTNFTTLFKDFLGYTTAHGFGRYDAAHGFGKFVWIVFLLGTYAGFSWHLSTLVTRFLSQPLLTVYDTKFEYQFPDIYVCPRNPISMSRIVRKLTEHESNFLRQNVELTRERFINLLNKSRNSLTDKQIIKLLDFDIWGGNVTFWNTYWDISNVLNDIEQQIMTILMTEDEIGKPQQETCYSLVDKGKNSYKGKINETAIGHQCDKWPASYPTEHAEGHNYCRNPDNKRAPWCFTTNPYVKWEYCAVPVCKDSVSNSTCYNKADFGKFSYNGTKSTTKSGLTCQIWNTTTPHNHNYTEVVLNSENYCRNPDSSASGPWCYTTNPSIRRETCMVPECPHFEKKCFRKEHFGEMDYQGTVSTTVSGLTCQDWRVNTPHVNKYGHANVYNNYSNNYCRNPGGYKNGLWCYTTDPDVEWEACGVPECTDKNIKIIASIIHNRISHMLLHMFGNDLYLNLIKCTVGPETCTSRDFITLAHPSFGICHLLNATRFIVNKDVKDIVLMPIEMELFSDSTDLKGQDYELPHVKLLDLSMYPIGSSSTTKGFDMYIMPRNEYPHNIQPLERANKIKVQSATHTYVHLGFNKKETFPDGTCIQNTNVGKISYTMHAWNSFLFDKPNVTSNGVNINNVVINKTNHWKDQLNKLETRYVSTAKSKHDLFEFTNTEYDCINTELIKMFVTNCNCIPAVLPIPAKYSDKSKYTLCLNGPTDVVKTAKCYQQQIDKMSSDIERVRAKCPARCDIAKYDISFYSVPWPFNNLQDIRASLKQIAQHFGYPYHFNKWRGISGLFFAYVMSEHLLNLKESSEFDNDDSMDQYINNQMFHFQGIYSNLAKISIEINDAHGERVYSEEAYPIKNLFADLGGLLGLWSGISVLTICEIFELFLYFIIIIHKRRKQAALRKLSNNNGTMTLKTFENNGYVVNNKV